MHRFPEVKRMSRRTQGKSSSASTGQATRTPLAAVNANIINCMHDEDQSSSSFRTPFKSRKIDDDDNNNTTQKKKKKNVETFTTAILSTKKKRTNSRTRRNDVNCEFCPTSSTITTFIDNSSLQMHSNPLRDSIIHSDVEKHLQSFNIPTNESFHIYETDGDETVEFFTTKNIDSNAKTIIERCQASTIPNKNKSSTTTASNAQQWEEEQCSMFAYWLNRLFYPEDGDSDHSISDEDLSAEWNSAKELFDSPNMHFIRNTVQREVKEGRLAIVPPRTDRFVLDEVYVQEQLTKLLLTYTPRWLQLGLGIILALNNEDHNMQQCMTKESLKEIIKERVLTEPTAVRKYTGGKCKTPSGRFESNLRITIHQHALSQIMILIFFLDKAKTYSVLTDNPCLFEKSSTMKSSEELLLSLCRDCFLKQGSIIKHLDFEGISVSHVQTPLDEYDFHVKNLAVDLKDGVRLARMIDAVTLYRSSNLLSSMRLPATTRHHKMYNVDLALSALRHLGVPHISDITTAHIVAAHQPRVLQLIWSIILYFDIPQFKDEINKYKASRLIQGYARRFLWLRLYRLAYHGVILFQSRLRGIHVRNAANTMKDAIFLIQRVWRGHHAKRTYEVKSRCIVRIQRFCRQRVAKRNGASVAIQRIWRGYTRKIDFACRMLDIITIQSGARRFIAKNRTDKIIQLNIASTAIQRVWRGYFERINFGFDLMDIITIQSVCRRFLATIRTKAKSKVMHGAATAIQRVWRGYSAMKCYGFQLLDIILAQSVCRQFTGRRKSMRTRSCRKIQSFVRMRIAMRKYSMCRRAICTIQTHSRRLIASNHARGIKSNVIELQRFCRGWLCRKECLALSHSTQVDKSVSYNRKNDDVDVSDIKTSVTQSDVPKSSLILNNSSSDDDKKIHFTSRHAPKMQLVGVVKGVQSSPSLRHAIQVGESTSVNSKPECDTADLSNRKALAISSSKKCLPPDDGDEIYFNSRHAPKRHQFHVASIVESVVDKSKHTANDVHIHAQCMNNSIDNKFINSSSRASGVIQENDGLQSASVSRAKVDNYLSSEFLRKQIAAMVVIQARWRRAIASQTLLRKKRAKHWATKDVLVVEKALQLLKQEVASVLIQSMWRRVVASRDFSRMRNASIVCQRYLRKWAAGRNVFNVRLQAAKVELHSIFLHSAMTMQRSQSSAAIQIQRVWRGYRANVDHILVFLAAIKIQSFARKIIAATKNCRMKAQHDASIIIQAVARGIMTRLHKGRVYTAVLILQRAARVMITCKVERFAATEIQRIWRGYIGNLNYIIFVISSIKVQAMFRCHQARQKTNVLRANRRAVVTCFAATEIQRYWRGFRLSIEFKLAVVSVVKIQAAARGWQTKREIYTQHASSRAIQRIGRGFLAKRRTRRVITDMELQLAINRRETDFSAATAIQRMWRGYQANVNFMLAVMSAIKIQCFTRLVLAKINNSRSVEKKMVENEDKSILRVMTEHGKEIESDLFSKAKTLPANKSIRISSKLCHSSSSSSSSSSSAVEVRSNNTPTKSFVSIRSLEFGRRTTNAMRTLLVSKNFNEILKAATETAQITQQSFNDCQFLISNGIDQRLISILRLCNRSLPHLELVRIIMSVLTNLAHHPTILSWMAKENSVDALTDVIQMFRDKAAIFALASSLLEKMLLVNNGLVSKYSTPENRKLLRCVMFFCQKKMSEQDDMHMAMKCLENVVRIVNASCAEVKLVHI